MASSSAPDFSIPSLNANIIPAVDQTYGLQDMKLETPIERIQGLVFSEQRGELMIYTRPTDSMQIGQAVVDSIEYGFTSGLLTTIILGFSHETTGINLRNVFSRVYGRGYGTDKLVLWKGRKAEIIYQVKANGVGDLIFFKREASNDEIIRLLDVVNKTPEQVGRILGKIESTEKVSPSGTPCEASPCNRAFYQGGKYEIVYINGRADWITINQVADYTLDERVIEKLGFAASRPTFGNPASVLRWENIAGLREISFFNNGSGKVDYISIKVTTT